MRKRMRNDRPQVVLGLKFVFVLVSLLPFLTLMHVHRYLSMNCNLYSSNFGRVLKISHTAV